MWNSRAVVFDLDDTLYEESTYFHEIFKEFCGSCGWPDSSYSSIVRDFQYVRKNKKDIFSFFLAQNKCFWENTNKPAVSQKHNSLHESLFWLYKNIRVSLSPKEGLSDWMNYACNHSLKLGVLTNGVVEAQINKWRSLDFVGKDKVVFLPARKCGVEKPSEEPFVYISKSLNFDLAEITFVGDNFENDLAYPLSRGSTGILINPQITGFIDKGSWFVSPSLEEALSGYKLKI